MLEAGVGDIDAHCIPHLAHSAMYYSWWANNVLGFFLDTVRHFPEAHGGPCTYFIADIVYLGTVLRLESEP